MTFLSSFVSLAVARARRFATHLALAALATTALVPPVAAHGNPTTSSAERLTAVDVPVYDHPRLEEWRVAVASRIPTPQPKLDVAELVGRSSSTAAIVGVRPAPAPQQRPASAQAAPAPHASPRAATAPIEAPRKETPLAKLLQKGVLELAWPARGAISTHFGEVGATSPRGHAGLDIAAPTGTPIYAAFEGKVLQAGWNNGGYGNLVVIEHAGGFETWYAHLHTVGVEVGDKVGHAQKIGTMGSTGYSTGPHLHFEVRHNGALRNPMNYL